MNLDWEERRVDDLEWSPIDWSDVAALEIPFSEVEIKKEVFENDGSKSPGPDGFTLAFYQSCWEMVDDLMKVFIEFYL